jgi:hypothetical protein
MATALTFAAVAFGPCSPYSVGFWRAGNLACVVQRERGNILWFLDPSLDGDSQQTANMIQDTGWRGGQPGWHRPAARTMETLPGPA